MIDYTPTSNWPQDMRALYTKFGVHEAVDRLNSEQLRQFLEFRMQLLHEELRETENALNSGDPNQLEELVDGLIDLCVVAIGTLDSVDVDSTKAWARVFIANWAKERGFKPGRPNPFGMPDLIKPEGWTAPTHADNIGLLGRLYESPDGAVDGE